MPLLFLQLKYDGTTKEQTILEIPFQPKIICLKEYQIHLTTITNMDALYISLKFLDNNQNIISNVVDIFHQKQIIPLYNDRTKISTYGKKNITFHIKDIIKPIRDWFIYDKNGNEFLSQPYIIDLVFTYYI
jgi:hypothetical protein